jgi:hypothetical protein
MYTTGTGDAARGHRAHCEELHPEDAFVILDVKCHNVRKDLYMSVSVQDLHQEHVVKRTGRESFLTNWG